jgi:hypothetical protein
MRTASVIAAGLLAAGLAMPAEASVHRIDESGTTVSQPVVSLQWRQPLSGRMNDNLMHGQVRVDVRLNLQPWLNRPARIFLVLAASPSGAPVRVRWNTQGRLLHGALQSGERVQVYEGIAQPATFTDAMLMTIEADGETFEQPDNLRFHFEIEVSP